MKYEINLNLPGISDGGSVYMTELRMRTMRTYDMTLGKWCAEADIEPQKDENLVFIVGYDVTIPHHRKVWNLSDFQVARVIGDRLEFIPRARFEEPAQEGEGDGG